MPTLQDVLEQTYVFRAAGSNGPTKLKPDADVSIPAPKFTGSLDDESLWPNAAIWEWEHRGTEPGVIRKGRILDRRFDYKMRSAVFEELRVKAVETEINGHPCSLPLDPSFVLAKYHLAAGRLSGKDLITANTDESLLVVFGYVLTQEAERTPTIKPLTIERVEELSDDLFPSLGAEQQTEFTVEEGGWIDLVVDEQRILVAFSAVFCKEAKNCEPGGVLAAAKLYPHVMLISNFPLKNTQAELFIDRPQKPTMLSLTGKEMHDHGSSDESHGMGPIAPVFFTDTNEGRMKPPFNVGPPLPYWHILFDYYNLAPRLDVLFRKQDQRPHPGTRDAEVCVVSSAAKRRFTSPCVQRAKPVKHPATYRGKPDESTFYEGLSSFEKFDRQAEYDNLHLAPPMKWVFETNQGTIDAEVVVLDDIVMAPFCVHDCLHTHFRWGGTPDYPDKEYTRGFEGRRPFRKKGAPMVPEGQSVYIKLDSEHSFTYRAVQESTPAGEWETYYHHGSFYAITADTTVASAMWVAMIGVQRIAAESHEPFVMKTNFWPSSVLSGKVYFSPFYWRLRYAGYIMRASPPSTKLIDVKLERLLFDLSKCLT